MSEKMSKRERKAMRKKIHRPDSSSYDYCVDSALDRVIKYDTNYPKNDENDYTAPMRTYKK